jgi:hypothetical protein
MTADRWPTDADVARMREVYFAEGPLVSDVGIRLILETLPPAAAAELREELSRPVPERVAIDNIFRRVEG